MGKRFCYRRRRREETIGLSIIGILLVTAVFFRTAERASELGFAYILVLIAFVSGAALIAWYLYRLGRGLLRAYRRTLAFAPYESAELHELIAMDPFEFEKYIGRMYEHFGYAVFVTPGRGDKGIDLIMKKGGKRYAVQIKKYGTNHPVESKEVRDFYGSFAENGYDGGGYFVTTSGFTRDAREWVGRRALTLINGKALLEFMKEVGVTPWYRDLLSPSMRSPVTERLIGSPSSKRQEAAKGPDQYRKYWKHLKIDR